MIVAPAGAALTDGDNACLGCHGQEGLSKTFGKGESLPLRVDGAAFEGSVHAPLGCAACHADVDLKTHPAAGNTYDSVRAYSGEARRMANASDYRDAGQAVYNAGGNGTLAAGLLDNLSTVPID